ncbi:MAG: aspartate--tRNA(Asn) ligase [Candidatus Aenigmarchaeota archaeon]|nr:aspartate--tRNA(Asn) ligase [Candidatus Aenigmarchaeota archaeon]
MERTYTNDLQSGKKSLVKGWISSVRDLGGLKFLILRDREGLIQITIKKAESKKILELASSLVREDCISVTGMVKNSPQAPGGKEIIPESIELVSKAKTPLPIETSDKIITGLDKRFDFRFMDVRNPKVRAIFRVKDIALTKMREYFESNGFVEVHTPIIQAAGAEGGATMFPMVYYQKEAFLRQSPQLYKQMLMASSLDRIYEIGSVFRAEKFHTRRHVSEYLSVDMEMAWIESEEDVLRIAEGLVEYTLKGLKKDCKKELEVFGAKVNVPELPFKRLTYSDVLGILAKNGLKKEWGDDLDDPDEKLLGQIMEKKGHEWYFITKYPGKIKPFYIMMEGKASRGMDLDCRGLEIASGGQREHRYEELVKVMKQKGLDPHKFEFYLSAFQYGMPPHGGFGLGSERFVQQVLGIENIKEIILFPRTPERLVP